MKNAKSSWDQNFMLLMINDSNFYQSHKDKVPKQTYHYWKTHGLQHIKGKQFAPFQEDSIKDLYQIYSNKRIFQLAKASAHANKRFLEILSNIDPVLKKNILQPFKQDITSTYKLISQFVSKKKACELLGENPLFISYQKNDKACHSSAFNQCQKKHPMQMLSSEVQKIKDTFLKAPYKFWQKSSVYWEMRRNNIVQCSLSSFYRVTKKLGIKSSRAFKSKQAADSLKAEYPSEIIHMDVSKIPLNNRSYYLYSIIDNYSSKVLSHSVYERINSKYALKTLLKACKEHQLHFNPETLMITDGGSEFKKYVSRFLELPCVNIIHKIAYTDINASNNKIEAFFRQIKSHHLRLNGTEDIHSVRKIMDKAIEEFSNKYIHSLGGVSPNEKFNGVILDIEVLKIQHQQAIENRKTQNRNLKCFKC